VPGTGHDAETNADAEGAGGNRKYDCSGGNADARPDPGADSANTGARACEVTGGEPPIIDDRRYPRQVAG
jgi:hypothetical protein